MTASSAETDIWLGLGPASFQLDGGFLHQFTAQVLSEGGSNRIAKRDRPFRDGAKLDFVGNNSDEWTIDCIYNNDVTEPGAEFDRWPSSLEDLIADLKTGDTGTLNLPWKRGLRVKGLDWQRVANANENRSGETLRVKFQEDNEDSLDRQAFDLVTVKATLPSTVEAAQFDAESEGMDLFAFEDITQLAADIVGLLNRPGEVSAALLHAGNRMIRAVDTIANAFSTGEPGRDQLNTPAGAGLNRQLLEMRELGARAVGEGRPRPTRTMRFDKPRDIWSIATEVRQGPRDLMTINEQIEDFAYIPPGTPVRVFAD
jgi:hypothetical protein